MKKTFGAALLALPFLAVSARAQSGTLNIQIGGNFYVRSLWSNALPQTGPWYLYWPLEGHFQTPAPTGYPYWPSPQGLPRQTIGGPGMQPHPPAYAPQAVAPPRITPVPTPAPTVQPTSSYRPVSYTGPAPSYWYDR